MMGMLFGKMRYENTKHAKYDSAYFIDVQQSKSVNMYQYFSLLLTSIDFPNDTMASDLFISQTRSRLDQQEANFEAEIRKVEEKISKEKKAEADLIKLQAQRAHVDESAAEAKRAEDKILRGTDKLH